MLHKWEALTESTDRMEVPGGWLYRTMTEPYGEDEGAPSVAMVFVPRVYVPPDEDDD